jgi:hypothetical protein
MKTQTQRQIPNRYTSSHCEAPISSVSVSQCKERLDKCVGAVQSSQNISNISARSRCDGEWRMVRA